MKDPSFDFRDGKKPSVLFMSKLPADLPSPLSGITFPLYKMAQVEGTIILIAVMVVMTELIDHL